MGWWKKLGIAFILLSLFSLVSSTKPPLVLYGYARYDGKAISQIEIKAINEESGEVVINITDNEGKFVITMGNPPYEWNIGDKIILEAKGEGEYSCLEGKKEITIETEEPLMINIQLKLKLDFYYKPSSPMIGEVVNFSAITKAKKFKWDFGDGNISYEKNPIHIYKKAGIYNVTLTIYFGEFSASITKKIEVFGGTVNFTYEPSKPKVKEEIKFYGVAYNNITNYTWDFGDGSIAYGKNVSHAYEKEGKYKVKLIVRDNKGNVMNITKEISIKEKKTPGFDLICILAILATIFKRKKFIRNK